MSVSRVLRQRPAVVAVTGLGLSAWGAKCLFIRNFYAESPSSPPSKVFSGLLGPTLRLESSETVSHNTKRLRFAFPDSNAVSGLTLTSSVLTVSWPAGRWFPVLRPYTPINSLDEPGSLELMIKRYPNGKASNYLHSLSPDDKLFFLAALPGYKYKPNTFSHVTMIAGGAGITPIYQLTQGILRNPEDKTKITMIVGVNTDVDVLLKNEFDEFERKFPGRFKAIYTVSHPVEGSVLRKGYVTKELLLEVLGEKEEADTKVFVCGPPPMEEALVGRRGRGGILKELGFGKDEIYQF
ncbi:NADH-cytochrome b5 reductase-like protein [Leptodontidium sp. MPI-SDFR-AT-0119]|nr:NADH-cytochrome b5 reductase-like protein [Leptodontidium sp. MPI-SDFR-AT-0119]